jgi:hypothetical protein
MGYAAGGPPPFGAIRRRAASPVSAGSQEVAYVPKSGHDDIEPTEGEKIHAMEFVARALVQIPDPRRRLVRYYGAYSSAARGKRKQAAAPAEPPFQTSHPRMQPYRTGHTAPLSGADLAELIRRVYEVDPLANVDGQFQRAGYGGWEDARHRQQARRLARFMDTAPLGTCVIECGAGEAIPTVRNTSERLAARLGGTLVRINVREPETPPGHIGLAIGALAALTRIEALLEA